MRNPDIDFAAKAQQLADRLKELGQVSDEPGRLVRTFLSPASLRANALVVFPGGFGTFDELFEILTLRQTNKAPPIPIVLFDEAYWRSIFNFEALAEYGMISREDLKLFHFAEDAEGIWAALLACGLKPHQSIE